MLDAVLKSSKTYQASGFGEGIPSFHETHTHTDVLSLEGYLKKPHPP